MPLGPDVVDRLLVAKGLLARIRFLPIARPDRISLARHILTAHDAAELSLAAISRHLGRLPQSPQTYLMEYFPAIQGANPGQAIPGRDYFSQLNRVRADIKHHGIFPDPQQWYRVGERTWTYVSMWCQDYLGLSLEDLDESALIADPEVKHHYGAATEAFRRESYRETLEHLGVATGTLFRSSRALRNLAVGVPRAEDAIKLAAFGVHANDYLALQEFLPQLFLGTDQNLVIKWEQEKYGHPANWTRHAAEFSLRTFVNVALRIQDAEWIPGAVDFAVVYEHKITALVDGVEIVVEQRRGLLDPPERVVVRTLRKGDTLRGHVTRKKEDGLVAGLLGGERKPVLSILNFHERLWGEVEAEKVRVTCVPRDHPKVREYFPDLPEIDYVP